MSTIVPEILPPLLDCYARMGQMQRAEKFLLDIIERSQGVVAGDRAGEVVSPARAASRSAIDFLTRQLRQRPSVRGLMTLIVTDLHKSKGEARENLLFCRTLRASLLEGQAMYRCTRCGFGAKSHHWQCPSCKTWGSVRPIHGVPGE